MNVTANANKDEKTCKWCSILKPLKQFYLSGKNCHRSECKQCTEQKGRERYSQYKDRKNQTRRIYYQGHKEEILKGNRASYQKNSEERREYARNYYHKHREALRANKRIYKAQKRKANPQYRLQNNLRRRLLFVLRGQRKENTTFAFVGCSYEDLKKHMESQFRGDMTWENYGTLWNVDHIIPCSAFNLTNSIAIHTCFHYTNLRPCYVSENIRKGNKIL